MAKGKSKNGIDKLSLKETWNQLKKVTARIEQDIDTLNDIGENNKKEGALAKDTKKNIKKAKALAKHLRDLIQKTNKENKVDKDDS